MLQVVLTWAMGSSDGADDDAQNDHSRVRHCTFLISRVMRWMCGGRLMDSGGKRMKEAGAAEPVRIVGMKGKVNQRVCPLLLLASVVASDSNCN